MNKGLKIFLWIFLFPFMLIYWGWKNKKKPVIATGILLILLVLTTGVPSQKTADSSTQNVVVDENTSEGVVEEVIPEDIGTVDGSDTIDDSDTVQENVQTELEEDSKNEESIDTQMFEGYRLIEVDGGDQSGYREANVVVDIGFGDREYYAFTNEYGQLVKVIAKEIILQDDANEPVLSTGRYYPDEAKVPGVESKTLDEGHVIADSLGGVSNAYNITPQNSTLNRHGDQAYMEKAIRNAGGCTDFTAIISYPNNETQIPSHYSYTYTLKGKKIHDEFDNIDPDEVNAGLESKEQGDKQSTDTGQTSNNKSISITKLDKVAEYIVIKNTGSKSVNLEGWKIVSVTGNQSFTFPEYSLEANAVVKVGDSAKNADVKFHWLEGKGIWNNTSSDPAELYNASGELVHTFND